jgi:hypothetical protein
MKQDQFFKLMKYIDAAIADANAGPEGLRESVDKISTQQELYDSFFKQLEQTDENIGKDYIITSVKNENEIALGLMEETSDILCKTSGESLPDAARRIMKKYNEHLAFFEDLLNPEQYGWAVNEDVRNEARVFLGIPRVKIKRK